MQQINEYQTESRRTAGNAELTCWCFGLIGESGEVVDTIKKHLYHAHPVDKVRDHIKEELGDVMWYVCRVADSFGLSMSDVLQVNIDKLRKRYPDGFSTERSINREKE